MSWKSFLLDVMVEGYHGDTKMIDIYIWLSIMVAAILAVVVYFIVTRHRRSKVVLTPVTPRYTRGYGYNPGMTIVETNSGFTEGMIIGSMLNDRPVVQETVINETVVVEDGSSAYTAAGAPDTFSGGDSDGGGATSSWDSSSSDGGSSSDSGSSSSDSGSYDSGSSDSGSSGDY